MKINQNNFTANPKLQQRMSTGEKFERLCRIMHELREKCPWDKEQTIDSLRTMTIEETYELSEAILQKDYAGVREELGDLMLHLVFYAEIGKEENYFTLDEVLDGIAEKLIQRHPHIYGDVQLSTSEEVKRNWEKLKLKEGKKSVLSGVPDGLPATIKSWRMQEKARKVGFEWDNMKDVWKKVQEELSELEEAVESADQAKIEDELGDVFFSLINYARFLKTDPESALEKTNRKFRKRFMKMEELALQENKSLAEMSLAEMDALWNSIKGEEK